MAQAKSVTETIPLIAPFPTDTLPKRQHPPTRDVIDNHEHTAPHLKPVPVKEDDIAPPLLPPSEYKPQYYVKSLTSMLESISSFEETQTQTSQSIIDSVQTTITNNYRKSVDKAIDENKYVNHGGWCDYFRKIAVCLLAAFSIVIGGNLIGVSPLTGGAMIASGVTTLLGNLLFDSNSSPQASAVLTVLSAGFGLIAGLTFNPDAIKNVATQIAMAAMGIVSSAGELGKQYSHYQIEVLKSAQDTLQELITRCRNIIGQQAGHLDSTNSTLVSTFTKASESVLAIERAKTMIIGKMVTANAV